MNRNYEDIINLPHHISKTRPQMSLEQRSAQFAPFAALVGYEDEIAETGRLTVNKIELDEETKQILNRRLQEILENLEIHPKVAITYFVPDNKKSGGKYRTVTGNVLSLNTYKNSIVLTDKTEIQISEIIKLVFE